MIRIATRADLPRIIQLFARSNDAPYDLAVVAEEKCFGAGVSGDPNVSVFGDFAGVAVTCGKSLRILAVDRKHRWRGIGSALHRDAVSRGARIVAAEAGNYFTPGVVMTDTPTIDFFTKRGFRETANTYNLVATNLPTEIPQDVMRVSTQSREPLLTFIEKEFGRIWRFEASNAGDNLFFVEVDGNIAGFAAHDANNRGLGFFGPTGVARAHRGRGLGAALLRASLADLQCLGYERAIIPWTDALDFYRKACGATVAAQFVTLARDVDSAP
ncbi:MAG TPA: GNAT family N-acetyltransferase [Thermoanaerobaculia bacterium]|nr:GNAT family N-acetyltransferase [Thermoanaerobaculia bacterium]